MSTNKTAQIKSLIAASGSKLMSITFIKKDGSERVMTFNPKMVRAVKGNKASESAQKAVASRKVNNPNLINVMDQVAFNSGKPEVACWRSINTDTVTQVKSGGEVLNYEV